MAGCDVYARVSLLDEIRTARARLQGEDPRQWIAYAAGRTPAELSSQRDQQTRREFLYDSLEDPGRAERAFERILQGNELQDVNYLARGARAAQSVARIAIRDGSGRLRGWGTGFLIAPGVLLTNNHVLADATLAARSEAQFNFERDIDGRMQPPVTFSLHPGGLFLTDEALDFTVVAVDSQAQNAEAALSSYGHLPLVRTLGKITEGEWLTIIQHPGGEQKQVCVRENRFLRKTDDVIWYNTDTVAGSSGSPVFNNDWYVVGLHHSGVPETRGDRIQTIDGRDYDPQHDTEARIKWIANEGIRASRIVETLQQRLPAHALLQPLFSVTPAAARIPDSATPLPSPARRAVTVTVPADLPREKPAMSASNTSAYPKYISLGLRLDADGSVSVESTAGSRAAEAALILAEAAKKKKPPIEVPFDDDYSNRKGFQVDFLGGGAKRVNFPALSPSLQSAASKLLTPVGANNTILHYLNYSVVMHAERRFAIYSAANVSFGGRFEMSRPEEDWRVDPRIKAEHQITNFYYRKNQFDRGHLTRREDLEFGSTAVKALQSAADTMHWTNATPQHKGFNQSRELWQGVERHLLEQAILQDEFNAQVITGPVLEEDDPVYERFPDIQYPVRFWKVVAMVDPDTNGLFATAFILDQSDVIDQLGLDEAAPIGAFKTFQVKIAEVERLTGLTFTSGSNTPLSNVDPLRNGVSRRRRERRGPGRDEAIMLADVPQDYIWLDDLDVIQRAPR